MTFKELFLIKHPCDECIVNAACKKNLDCEDHVKHLKLLYSRVEYWKDQYPKLIVLMILVIFLSIYIPWRFF